jgi:uncharacterized protein YjbI with pentapeptide repeats
MRLTNGIYAACLIAFVLIDSPVDAAPAVDCRPPQPIPGRLTIRHPPIPVNATEAQLKARACDAEIVNAALRADNDIELENVVLKGEVRLTKGARPHRLRDIEGMTPDVEARLTNASIEDEDRAFTNVYIIRRQFLLKNCRVDGLDASGLHPVFFGSTFRLRGTIFTGGVDLDHAIFKHHADMIGTTFLGQTDFSNAWFDGGVDFDNAQFKAGAKFSDAHFGAGILSRLAALRSSGTSFNTARFGGRAEFAYTYFHADVNFGRASFDGGGEFFGAVFENRPDFGRASFAKALFLGTDFLAPVQASDVIFDGVADFSGGHFRQDVDFSRSTFGDGKFFETEFAGVAVFTQVTFKGTADFSKATFRGDTNFMRATFADAAFLRTAFAGPTDFSHSLFRSKTSSFLDATFGPGRATAGVTIKSAWTWITAAIQGSYRFSGAEFERQAALAGARLELNVLLATGVVLAAGIGLIVCVLTKLDPMFSVREPLGTATGKLRPSASRISPHTAVQHRAFLCAALFVLLAALAFFHHWEAGVAVDVNRALWGPAAILGTWALGVLAFTAVAFGEGGHGLQSLPWPRRRRGLGAASPLPVADSEDQGQPVADRFGSEFDARLHSRRAVDDTLWEFWSRFRGGVVGIAGRRGIGKSAIARAFLARREREQDATRTLHFDMAAPTRYDELAFLLSLFRQTCREVSRRLNPWTFVLDENWKGQQRRCIESAARQLVERPPATTWAPFVVVLVALPPCILYLIGSRLGASGMAAVADWIPVGLLGVFGLLTLGYVVLQFRKWSRRRSQLETWPEGWLLLRTEEWLDHLRYQLELGEQREASLSLPQGFGVKASQSSRRTERQRTLPELVEDFNEYIGQVVGVYPGGIVIHLDEIDKIEEAKAAREFLNRIKGVFANRRVFYAITVSDDILESYGLRTLHGTDPVDSSFDHIMLVEPMAIRETLTMLDARLFFARECRGLDRDEILGRGEPVERRLCLGIVMAIASGGVPREILRLTRVVLAGNEDGTMDSLLEHFWNGLRESAKSVVLEEEAIEAWWKARMIEDIDAIQGGGSSPQMSSKRPAEPDTDAWRAAKRLLERLREVYSAVTELRSRRSNIETSAAEAARKMGGPNHEWSEVERQLSWAEALRRRFASFA